MTNKSQIIIPDRYSFQAKVNLELLMHPIICEVFW